MISDANRLEGMDAQAKRQLLARLLRQRANGTGLEFELSSGQEALWFLHELAPDSAAYNVSFCSRVLSEVDPERLERALLRLMDRHPMLRCTIFRSAQGRRQRIGPVPQRCLEIVHASGMDEEELRTRVEEAHAQPFDLAAGPVFRCVLFSRFRTEHVLLLSVHHVFSDAQSMGLIVSDLVALYDNHATNLTQPPPTGYADYVKRQRTEMDSSEGREAWEYWRARLKDLSPTRLPADFPRPKLQSLHGASHHFELPVEVCQRIRDLARTQDATPFMVVAAALHVLLVRYCGSSVMPIGMPLLGRTRPEDEGIVGYFINPVVLCAPVEAKTSFRQHIAEMRAAAIGAQRFGEFPFPELVKRIQPVRDPGEMPIFQVTLNWIKASQVAAYKDIADEQAHIRAGSLILQAFRLDQGEGQFDLDLDLFDHGGATLATLKYRTDLFEPATIERLAAQFVGLLSAAVADPELPVSNLPLLTDAEHGLMVEWNATAKSYPEATIHGLFEQQSRRTPEDIALVFEGQAISYRELNHRANQLARRLRQLGVGPDTLVAVCLERSFEMVVALFGVLKAGGAYVPIDPYYPPERQAYMITDCQAAVILTQAKLAGGVNEFGARVLSLDTGWEEIGRQSGEDLDDGSEPDHLAYVIYTSGSTGKPKGAMNTHRGVCNRLLWMQDTYQLTASDRVLQKTPFSFDVSVWEFFWPLMTGARLVIARPEGHKDPTYLISLIQEAGVTTLHFVPSMLRVFLEAEEVAKCSTVKRVICSGEALPYELQERFFESLPAELHNLYGPTEAAVDVTYWECRRHDRRRLVPIGRPVANTQIHILDPQLQPVPIGVPGELYIGGVQVGRGYWRRPELTTERFIADPFRAHGRLYKTGDLARWLPDGAVEYLGRIDHQVKIRGFRIELGEIEAQLAKHPNIGEAVVLAREDTPGDKQLVGYYTTRSDCGPGEPIHAGNLRSYLSTSLPDYMIPSRWVRMDALPLTPNGKSDRNALPVPDADVSSQARVAYIPPCSETEESIAAVWQRVLGLEKVGRTENFFDLGGHSLLVTEVQRHLSQLFKRDIPVVDLFRHTTVAGIAAFLDGKTESANPDKTEMSVTRQREGMRRRREARSGLALSQ